MKVKTDNYNFTWETVITYIIGYAIILFCIYILVGDITTLTVSETAVIDKIEFNDELNKVTVEFKDNGTRREYTKTYKDLNIYNSIKQNPNPSITYNPYFKEDVYIADKLLPTWGELVLFVFGIFIIYLLMCNAVKIYRPKSN